MLPQNEVDPEVDYTRTYTGETPFGGSEDAEIDFEIAEGAIAPTRSAEEIEQESGFKEIPAGEHLLKVIGFLTKKSDPGPVVRKYKDAWFGDRRESFECDSVTVKLGLASDTSHQVLESFTLPPGDAHGLKCYYEGTSKQGGGPQAKGFEARKFFHFLERLGFPYPKGGKLPPEARKLGNWKGREIVGTIIAGVPYEKKTQDQTTGVETIEVKQGSSKVLLFSYRAAESTKAAYSRASELATQANGPGPQQAPSAAAPVRRPTKPRQPVITTPPGLDDI